MIVNGRGSVGIRRGTVVNPSYLLNTYSGAAVAYSLRKLNSSYSGSAIRVRRSNDSATQDIGFDASGNLDTTALTSFVGAGNGFVTTWYDQSGNGKHVTQTTATSQPQIVSSGTIYTKNGKPSIFWDNATSNKIMVSSTSVSLTELTIASVIFPIKKGNYDKVFNIGLDLTNTGINYSLFAAVTGSDWVTNDCLIFGTGYFPNQPPRIVTNGQLHPNNIMTHTFATLSTSNTKAFFNNNEISSYRVQLNGTVNVGDGIVRLGNGSSLSQQFGGYMQELILFSTNKISDRSGISSNQNSYYSIY